MLDVDALAQEIRRVDGSNSLGAGALAEALMPFLEATGEAKPVAWTDDGTLRAGSEKTAHRIITDEQKSGMPAAVSASFNVPLYAAPVPATPAQGVDEVLNAAADYMMNQYGIGVLRNEIDRERIKAALPLTATDTARHHECPECAGTGYKDKDGARMAVQRTPCSRGCEPPDTAHPLNSGEVERREAIGKAVVEALYALRTEHVGRASDILTSAVRDALLSAYQQGKQDGQREMKERAAKMAETHRHPRGPEHEDMRWQAGTSSAAAAILADGGSDAG